ncbi:hypothetical protein PsorP6_000052 [Peronosclerospora sorghi]|uniref:Uncharacterized protein n=1 Tax=Peronosclerospora sorghi TaxID=230839 RepID=A0ACC0WSW9_9STRA|nr:hypothetical protein PsorP6_000052 [Peronosclerospora sorghi]
MKMVECDERKQIASLPIVRLSTQTGEVLSEDIVQLLFCRAYPAGRSKKNEAKFAMKDKVGSMITDRDLMNDIS